MTTIMRLLRLFALLTQFSLLKANRYTEEVRSVLVSSIVKELSGVSKPVCVLRCRRSKECLNAAIQKKVSGNVCLHLKNSTDTTDKETTLVTVLEEHTGYGMNILQIKTKLKEVD